MPKQWRPVQGTDKIRTLYYGQSGQYLEMGGDNILLPSHIRLCELVDTEAAPGLDVPRYSHRNGETEPPTVAGWYWFAGVPLWTHNQWELDAVTKRPILLTVEDDEKIFWYGGYDDAEYACTGSWLQGQWWGPLLAPWETAPAQPQPTPFPVEVQPPAHVLEQILLDMEGDYSLDTLRYVVYNDAGRDEWLQAHSAGVPEPSWENAPEWAQWWSIEPDGNINWSEQEPQVIFYYWHSEGRHERVIGGFVTIPLGIDWRTLKRQRPAARGEGD